MTTWYIERIPAAGGTPDIRTLADWGIDGGTFTEAQWALGSVSISIPSNDAGSTAPAWGHLDHLILWAGNPAAGGTRRQHLWVLLPGHHAEPATEAHQYTLVGPWYWLEVTQFFYPLAVSDITTDPETGAATGCTWTMRHGTTVVWTSWAAQSSGTVQGQIHRALWCAIDNDAPIAIGAIDIAGLAPVLDQDGVTCADVVARAARYSPRASQWWDQSGETPIFRAASYANRPATSIALGPTSSAWDIAPRHDLRIDVVRVGYQWDNDGATAAWYDIAGDDTLKDGAHTLRSLVDCPDSATAANAASHYGIASQLYTALHSTPYTGGASWPDWGTGLPAVHTGHALNLTGALAEWATMLAPIASVTLTISAAAEDELSVALGLPDSLGANDLFQLFTIGSRLGNGALASSGGTSEPASAGGPVPGTGEDLNGVQPLVLPPGDTIVQSRGGLWTKCGFAEYTPDSGSADPSKRYRAKTGSGAITLDAGALGCHYVWATTGTSRYSATTGALVETMHYTLDGVDQGERLSGEYQGAVPACGSGYFSYHATRSRTSLSEWMTVYDGSLGGSTSGSHTVTLSDEDTADDAFARVIAAGANWESSPETGIRTNPTAGITGIRRDLRYGFGTWANHGTAESPDWQIDPVAGYQPWVTYQLPVIVERRLVDDGGTPDGEWEEWMTITHEEQADVFGLLVLDFRELAAPNGYEIRVLPIVPTVYIG